MALQPNDRLGRNPIVSRVGRRGAKPLVGLLGPRVQGGNSYRRLYRDPGLDSGCDVRKRDIVASERQVARGPHGLKYDVLWVKPKAHILYWSKRPQDLLGPEGGSGWPDIK